MWELLRGVCSVRHSLWLSFWTSCCFSDLPLFGRFCPLVLLDIINTKLRKHILGVDVCERERGRGREKESELMVSCLLAFVKSTFWKGNLLQTRGEDWSAGLGFTEQSLGDTPGAFSFLHHKLWVAIHAWKTKFSFKHSFQVEYQHFFVGHFRSRVCEHGPSLPLLGWFFSYFKEGLCFWVCNEDVKAPCPGEGIESMSLSHCQAVGFPTPLHPTLHPLRWKHLLSCDPFKMKWDKVIACEQVGSLIRANVSPGLQRWPWKIGDYQIQRLFL